MTGTYVAFYKGRVRKNDDLKTRLWHIIDFITRLVTRSEYSHCEVAIEDSAAPGVWFCYSASIRDDGVRVKRMLLPTDRWDLVKTPIDPETARKCFEETLDAGYDVAGVLSFILPIRENPDKWYCSEICARMIGLPREAGKTPAALHKAILEKHHA